MRQTWRLLWQTAVLAAVAWLADVAARALDLPIPGNVLGIIALLAAAFVVATGTLGSLLGAWALTLTRVASPFARGLTLGTISHAQGTAAALQENEEAGAMAGLAMILAGLLTVAFAPPVVWLLGMIQAS